ncbi:TVP38/TMEM64 family protein [Peribacillus sp. SCS-155]|uniref:TVP38/TMEM64 family protein n=1 Tax=Peribacillus sedimenti TaxID=3115297 RepID=UPI003905ADC1
MEELTLITAVVSSGSVFAPFFFILFHIFRQFLFVPVAVVCISGGILFGSLLGSIYSVIGLTLSSIVFYMAINKLPKTLKRLMKLKSKLFGNRTLNVRQITVLRLLPFVHFHLLSLCLMEKSSGIKHYVNQSFLSNLPLAFGYTVFGSYISAFSPTMVAVILATVMILLYVLREKNTIIKWQEFFQTNE